MSTEGKKCDRQPAGPRDADSLDDAMADLAGVLPPKPVPSGDETGAAADILNYPNEHSTPVPQRDPERAELHCTHDPLGCTEFSSALRAAAARRDHSHVPLGWADNTALFAAVESGEFSDAGLHPFEKAGLIHRISCAAGPDAQFAHAEWTRWVEAKTPGSTPGGP